MKSVFKIISLILFFLWNTHLSAQLFFTDNASSLGITITENSSSVLGGVSFFDYDNDGWDDITFASKSSALVKFFKNNAGTFVEQTFNFQVISHSKQVLWVDFDNDGDNDLFVTRVDNYNLLYENDGNFNFTNITYSAGLPTIGTKYTYGASFGDYDNDGYLDLFLSNKDDQFIIPNQLYKNNGDGTFTDISTSAGISPVGHLSFCSVFFDFNNDGFQDIYISNDRVANANILYKNNGDGTFDDVSYSSGTSIGANAMSTTIGDYNNDGYLDIYVTNTVEGNYLLKNNGNETFTDVAVATGTSFNSIGWGANFFDADNDADLDMYVSSMINNSATGLLTYAMYEQNPMETFTIPTNAGFGSDSYVSFANAIGDVNNDGFSDFVVANQAPDNHSVWVNQGNTNNYLKIKLEGIVSNKNGVGSWIEISINGNKQYRYTCIGESFLGQNSATEIFGLGSATNVDYVKVTWLSGTVDVLNNVSANQTIDIQEGNTLNTIDSKVNTINIYPNPTNGQVELKNLNLDVKVDVFNMMGKLLFTEEVNTTKNTINLDNYSNGIYLLKITNGKQIEFKKVVLNN